MLRGKNQILSCYMSVMLSPPKPLDEIQPNFGVWISPMNGMCNGNFFLAMPPGALGWGQNVKYHFISITKSISKIFTKLCVCRLVKNERYKTCQAELLFCRLGHALGVGLGDVYCLGAKIKFCPAICPLCYLLPNHWTKFNQIWCVGYSHEWGVQHLNIFGPALRGPWDGSKGQISFNFNYKVNFKYFYTKLCVCTHK